MGAGAKAGGGVGATICFIGGWVTKIPYKARFPGDSPLPGQASALLILPLRPYLGIPRGERGESIHKCLPLDEQTQLTIHWLGWNFPEIQLLCKSGSWGGGGGCRSCSQVSSAFSPARLPAIQSLLLDTTTAYVFSLTFHLQTQPLQAASTRPPPRSSFLFLSVTRLLLL